MEAGPIPDSIQAKHRQLQVKALTASPDGFLVNSTLVTGEKDAILIDGAFTLADAHRVVAQVLDSRKNLTHIYVTHGHPDHYFGVEVVQAAFPKAKLIASPTTVEEIKRSWKGKVEQWKPMYGQGLTGKPSIPTVFKENVLVLEGERLELVTPVQGDDSHNSYVWIPSLKAVIAGDIVYNGVHPWTAETTEDTRKTWASTLDKLTSLNPSVVIAGHQKPDAKSDASSLSFVKTYLADFDQAVASSKTPEEVQQKIKSKYPDLALDIIVKIGSEAAFKKPSKG